MGVTCVSRGTMCDSTCGVEESQRGRGGGKVIVDGKVPG